MTTHEATWDATQGLYLCRDLAAWSEDGDTWHDDHGGHPAASDEFAAATIRFAGGPRDGEMVS